MSRFRKKPVEVEAFQWGSDEPNPAWFDDACGQTIWFTMRDEPVIKTLEGDMKAERGDFIIRGVAGEIYPCKPDIFAATYEEVRT